MVVRGTSCFDDFGGIMRRATAISKCKLTERREDHPVSRLEDYRRLPGETDQPILFGPPTSIEHDAICSACGHQPVTGIVICIGL